MLGAPHVPPRIGARECRVRGAARAARIGLRPGGRLGGPAPRGEPDDAPPVGDRHGARRIAVAPGHSGRSGERRAAEVRRHAAALRGAAARDHHPGDPGAILSVRNPADPRSPAGRARRVSGVPLSARTADAPGLRRRHHARADELLGTELRHPHGHQRRPARAGPAALPRATRGDPGLERGGLRPARQHRHRRAGVRTRVRLVRPRPPQRLRSLPALRVAARGHGPGGADRPHPRVAQAAARRIGPVSLLLLDGVVLTREIRVAASRARPG